MGFFDNLFGGGAEKKAAEKNRQALAQYKTEGLGFLDSGLTSSTGELTGARDRSLGYYQPLTDLAGKYRQGSDLYMNAIGVNGADAARAAQESFTTSPGYQQGIDAGLDAINRRRAGGGMLNSGNADLDALTFAQNAQNKEYGSWLDRLSGVNNNALTATGAAASGQAGVDMGAGGGLANLYSQDAQNRVGLTGAVTQGNVNANNLQAQGEIRGANNVLGTVTSLAGLAGKALGGGFGFGGGGGGTASTMNYGGQSWPMFT